MAQWVIPVTVSVWVEAETLRIAKTEIRDSPPTIDVIGSLASYVSAPNVSFGDAVSVSKRPVWAVQR